MKATTVVEVLRSRGFPDVVAVSRVIRLLVAGVSGESGVLDALGYLVYSCGLTFALNLPRHR